MAIFAPTLYNAYFDASGHPAATGHASALFVSGWVSTVEKWAKFETLWLALLAEYNLPPNFHMTDFQAGYGVYAEVRKDQEKYRNFRFIADLVAAHLGRLP